MLAVDEQKNTSVLMTLKQFIDYLTKGPKFESKTNLLHEKRVRVSQESEEKMSPNRAAGLCFLVGGTS